MSRFRPAAVLLSMALGGTAVLLATTSSAGAAPGRSAHPALARFGVTSGLPIQVYIDQLTPLVVRPHTQVVVTGRLVNAESSSVGDVRVRLRVRDRAVVSRSELTADATRQEPLGLPLDGTTTPVTTQLAPGAPAAFEVRVPADNLHLGAFGVYPFAVEVLAADAGGPNDVVGRTPTFLPWVPAGGGFVPTRLAWVLPLVDRPDRAATPVFPDDHLASSVAAGGRLQTLLAAGTAVGPGTVRPPPRGAVDAQRAVPLTWAVEPSLMQSLADMSDGYRVAGKGRSTTVGSGQPAALAWLDVLRGAVRGGPVSDAVLALPYANVDVTALARAGLDADITTAVAHGRDVATSVLGVPVDPELSWPAGGFITTKALGDLAASGVRSVLLDEQAVPLSSDLTFTPNAGAPLDAPTGPLTALLADDTLGAITAAADRAALAAAATVPSYVSPSPSSSGTPAATPSPGSSAPISLTPTTERMVEQRFLAETALITAEHPRTSRSVVVAPPLTWDPTPGLATALVADTGRVPWLSPTLLSTITSDPSVEREPLTYPTEAAHRELPNSYLTARDTGVVAMRRDLTSFRSILAPPIGPTAVSLDDATLRTESAAWRSDLGAGLALRREVAEDLARKRGAVNISSSRRLITLASRRGTIPITISNDLDQTVVVRLQLSAVSTARFTAPVTAPQTIAAGRKLTDEVRAVVNQAGLFPIKAQLLTPDGEPYGPAVTLRLRSTAYGPLALGITAGALGALFLAIIVRLVRRNRRRQRDRPLPASGTTP